MDPTGKSRQRAPAPRGASSALRLSSAAPTPRSSSALPTTPETPPLPNDRFVGWDAGPDPTTAICEYNVEGEWELRRDLVEISVGGSRECTITIPGRGLSARHFLLERYKRRLRLRDLDSSHGTFFRCRRLEVPVDLSPGDMFTALPMTFVCLNDEMRQHRPTVWEILGPGAPRSPDWVMAQAATDSGPMLLTGKAGCDLNRLAHAIHAMSLRRSQAPLEVVTVPQEHAAQVALGQQACKTSLILSLVDDGAPLDPQFASMLFDVSSGVRLIALASGPDIARRALTDARAEQMQHVEVRRLAYRSSEIERLLDRQFAEHAFHLRVADLTRANQDALTTYHWPGDFDELREIAAAIVAHTTLGALRPAAESLGISHHKLARRFERVGLRIPLFDRDE